MDNAEQLKQLADAQKRQQQAELEAKRQASLTSVNQQQAQTMPTFQQKRNQADTQSLLKAKNFAEYLAQRHQTNAGISAQAEMSRLNTLGNTMAGINAQEGQALQGFNNQVADINNQYQNNLVTTNNEIDSNLNKNLYNEKVRQQDLDWEKQKFYTQLNKDNETKLPEGMTFAQNGTAYQVLNGKVTPIKYTVKSTTKDSTTGKTTTQYENQKQFEYNRQGYWLQPQAQKFNFGTGKKLTAYTPWFNQYDNKNYIIAYDIPLPITGEEKDGKEIISNAYKGGSITKAQLKKLADKFGY